MWVHMVTNKYAHSRVPSLKEHLKQNIDITKMIFPEKYLPPYMRFGIIKRIIRFLFLPITLFALVVGLNYRPAKERIYEACDEREKCLARCQTDHFPNLK